MDGGGGSDEFIFGTLNIGTGHLGSDRIKDLEAEDLIYLANEFTGDVTIIGDEGFARIVYANGDIVLEDVSAGDLIIRSVDEGDSSIIEIG